MNKRALFLRPLSHSIRADIQALRCLAVIAVLIYHVWPSRLEGGYAGVDVFFVISGYLMTKTIMGMIDKRALTGDRIRRFENIKLLVRFYAKRIRRLAPAALVCLFAILLLVKKTGLPQLQIDTAGQVIAAALFMQNYKLSGLGQDYLHVDDSPTSVMHFWSLSVEEQFYFVWPLLLIVLASIAGLFIQRKQAAFRKGRHVLTLVAITILTLISLAYCLQLTSTNPTEAYYATPARIWELMLGGVVFFLPPINDRDLRLLIPWAGVVICTFSLWWLNDAMAFPSWRAALPTVGCAMVIWGGSMPSDNNADMPRTSGSRYSIANISRIRPVQWLGDISYSLYLWHWPLISLAPYYLPDGELGRLDKIAIFMLSIAIGAVSYYCIERPFRTKRNKPAAMASA